MKKHKATFKYIENHPTISVQMGIPIGQQMHIVASSNGYQAPKDFLYLQIDGQDIDNMYIEFYKNGITYSVVTGTRVLGNYDELCEAKYQLIQYYFEQKTKDNFKSFNNMLASDSWNNYGTYNSYTQTIAVNITGTVTLPY